VAGVLIAPLFNVQADMGTLFGLKAFAVAILGGITSAWGVMGGRAAVRRGRGAHHRHAGLGLHADHHLRLVIVVLALRPNGCSAARR
jgi:branched-chain amino acid transport system permease protein